MAKAAVPSPSGSNKQATVSEPLEGFASDAKLHASWNSRAGNPKQDLGELKAWQSDLQEGKTPFDLDFDANTAVSLPSKTDPSSMEHEPVTLLMTVREEEPHEEKLDEDKQNRAFEPFPYLEGWRGLAHYRTESRRKVVKKKPDERTTSDLYVLEESVKNVKLISDLPLAKRLEVCKYLGYEVWDESQHIYEQGATGTTFYIVFTGLVRATICEEGVQEPKTKVVLPGDGFGELALLSDDTIMADTAFTTERSEFLTLTRKDYEKILKIEKTPEMKARVKFLKEIEAFQNVSKQSLRRLANVLHSRHYAKNKVITFQGDEAFEMFFIKSGECRIIMETTVGKKPVLRLPRVSTFLDTHRPSVHHKCNVEVLLREKDYGRPSVISRGSQHSPSRLRIPTGLPDQLLSTPDLIHELALGHTRAEQASKESRSSPHSRSLSRMGNAARPSRSKSAASTRPLSAPSSFRLSAWGEPIGGEPPHEHKKSSQTISFQSPPQRGKSVAEVDGQRKSATPAGGQKKARATSTTKDEEQANYAPKRRRSTFAQKYTLDTFLSEVEAKERMIVKEIDFSEKDHALWHMGMTQGAMRTGFSEDVKYYRNKFQRWARGVLDRERALLAFNIYDDQQETPSFTQGAPLDHIMRLQQGSGPQSKNRKIEKDAMILDIGALQAGSYFGESLTPDRIYLEKNMIEIHADYLDEAVSVHIFVRGLLQKTRRAVSIVTICPVEVLVLNIWDFHRHCDRDIITALGSHDYRREEQIYKQYLKNCRWERFKKKCLDDIVQRQNNRRCERLGARGMRYIPKADASNPLAPPPAEWK